MISFVMLCASAMSGIPPVLRNQDPKKTRLFWLSRDKTTEFTSGANLCGDIDFWRGNAFSKRLFGQLGGLAIQRQNKTPATRRLALIQVKRKAAEK
jgi:hypothetical protein